MCGTFIWSRPALCVAIQWWIRLVNTWFIRIMCGTFFRSRPIQWVVVGVWIRLVGWMLETGELVGDAKTWGPFFLDTVGGRDGSIWLVCYVRILGNIPWLRSQTRDIVFIAKCPACVSEEKIQEIQQNATPKSTKRATQYGLRVLLIISKIASKTMKLWHFVVLFIK